MTSFKLIYAKTVQAFQAKDETLLSMVLHHYWKTLIQHYSCSGNYQDKKCCQDWNAISKMEVYNMIQWFSSNESQRPAANNKYTTATLRNSMQKKYLSVLIQTSSLYNEPWLNAHGKAINRSEEQGVYVEVTSIYSKLTYFWMEV